MNEKIYYVVNTDANDLDGWDCESLAEALQVAFDATDLTIVVETEPNQSGGGGLQSHHDELGDRIDAITEGVVCG